MPDNRQQAHELIDRMAPAQVSAVVHLLQIMLDPLTRTLADAPMEDEPIGEEEVQAVAASRAWLSTGAVIPNDEILAEFGLDAEKFERLAKSPAPPERSSSR